MNPVLRGFLRKEFLQIIREPRVLAMVFVAPVLQLILLGYALSTEMRNIKLAVIAEPGDLVMSRIAERAYSSGWFVRGTADPADPVSSLKSRRAEVVLVAPPGGLTRGVARGNAPVQALVDATNAVRARTVEFYLSRILAVVMAELGPPAGSGRSRPSVLLDFRMLYNPSLRSAVFMVPAVIVLVLGIDSGLLLVFALAREKEMGTIETLIAAPVKPWEILLGKIIPTLGLMAIAAPIVLGIGVFWFGVPFRGPLWQLILGSFLYVVSMAAMGTLVSTLVKNQQQAMMGMFMVFLPCIMLSGIFFPVENMPDLVRWVAYLNPIRYFVNILRNIMLKGGAAQVVWPNMAALAVLSTAAAFVAIRRFKQTLN
jgi:ABC-2 type transport system permease protein